MSAFCRNFLDIVSYVAQITITVMHLGRLQLASNGLSVLMAMQVLILWVKVQYFARWDALLHCVWKSELGGVLF